MLPFNTKQEYSTFCPHRLLMMGHSDCGPLWMRSRVILSHCSALTVDNPVLHWYWGICNIFTTAKKRKENTLEKLEALVGKKNKPHRHHLWKNATGNRRGKNFIAARMKIKLCTPVFKQYMKNKWWVKISKISSHTLSTLAANFKDYVFWKQTFVRHFHCIICLMVLLFNYCMLSPVCHIRMGMHPFCWYVMFLLVSIYLLKWLLIIFCVFKILSQVFTLFFCIMDCSAPIIRW